MLHRSHPGWGNHLQHHLDRDLQRTVCGSEWCLAELPLKFSRTGYQWVTWKLQKEMTAAEGLGSGVLNRTDVTAGRWGPPGYNPRA